MNGGRKPVVWLHGEVKSPPFTAAGRVEAGTLLRLVQEGESLGLPQSRPMPSIGPRCHELRVRDAGHNWRIVYRIDPDAILITGRVCQGNAENAGEGDRRLSEACRPIRHPGMRVEAMNNAKRKRLEAAGFRFGDAADFLGLSPAEEKLVALRVALAKAVRRRRERAGLTQGELAARLKSSQSRVAKLEAAAPGVSLDLMFGGLFAAGGSLADVACRKRGFPKLRVD